MKKIEKLSEEYMETILTDQRNMNYEIAYQDGIRKGIELAREEVIIYEGSDCGIDDLKAAYQAGYKEALSSVRKIVSDCKCGKLHPRDALAEIEKELSEEK